MSDDCIVIDPSDPAVIERAARAIAVHEPIGGGNWCSCAQTDNDGRRDSITEPTFDHHVAAAVLAAITKGAE